ncbi:MAG TPA: prolipoprotein diacylglyceryl transferase [Miltoncostaea sp.]|nr:prolipoprotein diacylglyceryl transferase [Miltoncostaea sp.]
MNGALLLANIPAPGIRQFSIGPFDIRLYALCLLAGVVAAAYIAARRWKAEGGDPELVLEVTLWSVLGGLIGARLYHDITSWNELSDHWYAPFAIWEGGLGIWGGVLVGVLVGAWVVHRRGESVLAMMDAAAPGILVAQGIGRLGNYFNQELYGGPTNLPWGLDVDPSFRPDNTPDAGVYHPTFLYEMLWNFGGAALIVWLGHRFRIRPPGVFCLYVMVYCAGRIWWEVLRVDPAHHFLGQRLNFWVALIVALLALVAFLWSLRRWPPGSEPYPKPTGRPLSAKAVPAESVPRTAGGRAKTAKRRP